MEARLNRYEKIDFLGEGQVFILGFFFKLKNLNFGQGFVNDL